MVEKSNGPDKIGFICDHIALSDTIKDKKEYTFDTKR